MATWVITGANRGLGLEFVKQLLDQGHTVVAGVRTPGNMDFLHRNLTVLTLDVASTDSVQSFANEIKSITDSIDVLVNNAGIMDGRWQSLSEVLNDALGTVLPPRTGLLTAAKPCGNNDSSIPSSSVK